MMATVATQKPITGNGMLKLSSDWTGWAATAPPRAVAPAGLRALRVSQLSLVGCAGAADAALTGAALISATAAAAAAKYFPVVTRILSSPTDARIFPPSI